MHANYLTLLRCSTLVFSATILPSTTRAAAGTTNADAFPNYESYIKVSGQAASISGDAAAFQNRVRQPENGGGGIEDLHLSRDLSKATTLTVDGRALFGAESYLARLNVTKTEVGSVEAGYRRFRTFYDGVGGFFPLNRAWFPLKDQDLHVDRARFWAEAKLTLPGAPELELRYTNELRNGRKDSLHWGDSDFTGLPNNNPPFSPARKFIPSYNQLGERFQELEGIAKKTIGATTYQLTVTGERTHKLNTRFVTRYPGEVRLFPAPAATVLLPSANVNNQIDLSQTDGMDTDAFGVTATTVSVLTPKIKIRTGLNYHRVTTDFSGGRQAITSTPTATGVVLVPTYEFQDLAGGTTVKAYTANATLDLNVTPNFAASVAVRGEDSDSSGAGSFNTVAASGTPATILATTPRKYSSRIEERSVTPVVDLRYTGIPDLALYASASRRILNGDDLTIGAFNPITSPSPAVSGVFNNDTQENHRHYTVGASWRQSAGLTLRGELFHKDHRNSAVDNGKNLNLLPVTDPNHANSDRVGDRYILGHQFTGLKLTAVARAGATITTTTRYIYQLGRMQVTGFLPLRNEYDSMDAKNHTIDETVDWNPSPAFYMQASGNLVFNVINTVYPRAGIAPATATNASFDANNVLQNSNNNYFNGSLLAGTVLTRTDDLQLMVTYYRANNGDAYLARYTMPYGVVMKEYSVSIGLKHKFADKWMATAKVGYFDSRHDTTGGKSNFHGPLAYLAFEHAL